MRLDQYIITEKLEEDFLKFLDYALKEAGQYSDNYLAENIAWALEKVSLIRVLNGSYPIRFIIETLTDIRAMI